LGGKPNLGQPALLDAMIAKSRADITSFRDDFERRYQGSTYNPFENSAFLSLARFGAGSHELQVLKFDFRQHP
jgi:hypothetical protein